MTIPNICPPCMINVKFWIWPYKPSIDRRGCLWYVHTVAQFHARGWKVGAWWLAECLVNEVCYGRRLATIRRLLFLELSGLYIETSVIKFVCSVSQYDTTAVFHDQSYGLACIRSADIIISSWKGATKRILKSLQHLDRYHVLCAS